MQQTVLKLRRVDVQTVSKHKAADETAPGDTTVQEGLFGLVGHGLPLAGDGQLTTFKGDHQVVGPEAGDADGTLRRLSAALGIAPSVGREAYHRDYARLNPGAFFRTSYTGRTGADTFPLTPRR
jgi:hypothetical protein